MPISGKNTSVRFTAQHIEEFYYGINGVFTVRGWWKIEDYNIRFNFSLTDNVERHQHIFIQFQHPTHSHGTWKTTNLTVECTDDYLQGVYHKLGIEGFVKGPISDVDFKGIYDGFKRLGEEFEEDIILEEDYKLMSDI